MVARIFDGSQVPSRLMSPAHVQPSARHDAFLRLDDAGRVAAVENRLSTAIHAGLLTDGERLPSEQELAQQLGVSTVTLREALAGLRRSGLVRTRRGRGGGTFIRVSPDAMKRYLEERLRSFSIDELRDLGDHRAAIAAAATELAAVRASASDLDTLRHHVGALAEARTATGRHAADRRFHVEVAAATRSARLVSAEVALQVETGSLLWHVADDALARDALSDHAAIIAALGTRDACVARRTCVAHVNAETLTLIAAHRRLCAGARPSPITDDPRGPDPAVAIDESALRAASEAVLAPIRTAVDEVLAGLAELSALVAELAAGSAPLGRAALDRLSEPILGHLKGGAGPILGTGVVFAPGALAGAPRWLEWRWKPEGEDPVALEASLDPGDVRFYDYERVDWFTVPRDTGKRFIAGPFIDYGCTDRHVFTLTMPIVVAGQFLGVAGADVAVERIEELAASLLQAIPVEAALVNRRGRVIASNTLGLLPGTLWDEVGPAGRPGWEVREGATVLSDEGLSWAVVTRSPALDPRPHPGA